VERKRVKALQSLRASTAIIFSTMRVIRSFRRAPLRSPVKSWTRHQRLTALIRGVAAEAKRRLPGVRIIGVQAEQAPAYVRSWQQGRVVRRLPDACDTIADGLATLRPLETNVIAIRELVDEVRLVSEQELLDAIRILLLDQHVVAEPAGAAATAAFLQNPSAYADAEIVLLVTGANVSPEVLRRAVT
jgi:threonine dehydratase